MNSRRLSITLAVILCFSGAGVSLADNGAIALAGPVSDIEIDGDFNDWPADLPWHSIDHRSSGAANRELVDQRARFRVACDQEALYLAVEVTSDPLPDAVASSEQDRSPADRLRCVVYLDIDHHQSNLLPIRYDSRSANTSLVDANVRQVAVQRRESPQSSSRYEWRLNLKSLSLATYKPSPGNVVGLGIEIGAQETAESAHMLSWGNVKASDHVERLLGDVLLIDQETQLGTWSGELLRSDTGGARRRIVNLISQTASTQLTLCSDAQGMISVQLPADTYEVSTLNGVQLGSIDVAANQETTISFDMTPASQRVAAAGPGTKIAAGKTAMNGNLYRYLLMRGSDMGVAQAADGCIWVAADWCGLAQFDGHALTIIEQEDGTRIPCETVATDRSGLVWCGGPEGLFCYDGESVTRFDGVHGLARGKIKQIIEGPAGMLWIRTEQAICRYDGQTFATVYENESEATLKSLLIESTTRFWAGTTNGLLRLDSTSSGEWQQTKFGLEHGLPGESAVCVNEMLIDANGRMWIGTSDGLSEYDGQQFKNYTTKDGLIHNDIVALATTEDGRLWVSSQAGLDYLENGRFHESVRDMRIVDLFVDREENLWVVRGGLMRLDSNRPELVRTNASELIRGRYQMLQTSDGAIWTASPFGLKRYKDGIMKTFTVEDGLIDTHARCLLEDSQRGLWIGTEAGLSRFDGKRFRSLKVGDGLITNAVRALAEDAEQRIWIGTEAGISIYDPHLPRVLPNEAEESDAGAASYTRLAGHLTHLSTANGLLSDDIVSLLACQDGSVLIGTRNGTCRWRQGTLLSCSAKHFADCLHEDRNGQCWLGNDEGLFRLEADGWRQVESCGDSSVMGIDEDELGRLWLATKGGIKIYDGFAAQTLTTTDGVPDFWCRDVICDQQGEDVYFLSGMWLTRFRRSTSPPPVKVVAVTSDRRQEDVSEFQTNTSQSYLQFAFHATSFKTRSEEMLFQYRLVGHDDQWKLTRDNQVSYGRLPAGNYTFEVQAIDRDLTYSEHPAKVALTVANDFRQAALLVTLGCFVVAVVFLSTIVVKRDRGIRRLNVQLDQRVKERTAELEEETAENRKLHEQLLQAQKLDAVGTMASGIAHDFNNSLAVITGFAEVAKANSSDTSECIDHILTAANQAAGTTKNLLTFSRESPGERVPRELIQLVRDASRFLRKMLPTSIELTTDLPDHDAIWCSIDSVHIQQVLVNIAVNARDAMPEGGRISVTVRRDSNRPGIARLEIADNGLGMPNEVRERIFDPFFTTKARGQGTGLGMSIVHGIIEDHQGSIEINSAVGEGTTVVISLPQCAAHEPESPRAEPELRGNGEWILIAEDHRDVQSMVAAQLESSGFEVLTADNGQQALDVLRDNETKISLALLDIDLPIMDGNQCLQKISTLYPHLPTILMSGLSSVDPAQLETPFLRKPFDRSTLLTTIGDALANRPPTPGRGVLIVDDDELVRLSTKALLASNDIEVFMADGATSATSALQANVERIGTVLLDWNLPGTEPQSLLQQLQQISPRLRICAISGDLTLEDRDIRAKGFSQLLVKPVSTEQLIAAVRLDPAHQLGLPARSVV